jgi:uncharacterized protein (DUF2267 family)
MMTMRPHALARAENTALQWLTATAGHLDTKDMEYTFRVLRAWLHTVRDRLTMESAVHLAAQLPEFLRGVFYDGWVPSRIPMRFDAEECAARFSREAMISPEEVPSAAAAVSAAMRELFSPGQLDSTFATLPDRLHELFQPARKDGAGTPRERGGVGAAADELEARMSRMEQQLGSLTEAVRSLAAGLRQEAPPAADARVAETARPAHEMASARESSAAHGWPGAVAASEPARAPAAHRLPPEVPRGRRRRDPLRGGALRRRPGVQGEEAGRPHVPGLPHRGGA